MDQSDDDDEKSRTSRDADETSDSSALGRVGGARERRNFGDLGEATVGCREGLVCTPVNFGRSECLPENPNGNQSQEYCYNPLHGSFPMCCRYCYVILYRKCVGILRAREYKTSYNITDQASFDVIYNLAHYPRCMCDCSPARLGCSVFPRWCVSATPDPVRQG